MARARDNWEKLVRAILRSEQRAGHEHTPSGIAGAVPDSLQRSTNINAILQAADEIQSEDPIVARILCEGAYSMAQNLDPSTDGRGVLQFKAGLMSIIKQKLATKSDGPIDRNRDSELLWDFYNRFKKRHGVDYIEREEQKWRECSPYSANIGDMDLRSTKMKEVFATLRALVEVMETLSKDAAASGVGRLILEELRRMKRSDATISGDLIPYNIVPLEAPSLTNAIGYFHDILLAVDLALDCKDTQADLWNQICKDEYMAYAVQECYSSIETIMHSLVDEVGRLWVERVFREINGSISEGSLVITLSLKKLPVVLSRFTALTGLLTRNYTPELAKGAAKALYDFYDVVTHELLSPDLREQLDTWHILVRARNEGRLFSSIEWPNDPDIKEQVKRLHLLLTVKDNAEIANFH